MTQVKVRVPYGINVVTLKGMRYEADPYGFIYVPENIAEAICADPAYRKDGKREGLVDTTKADPIGTQISKDVAAKSAEAEKKVDKLGGE